MLAALLFVFSGCRQNGAGQGDASGSASVEDPARPVEQKIERGPLQVRLILDRSRLDITETAVLRLEAEAPEDYAVELPKFDEGTGQFMKPDVRFETPRLTERNTMLYAREYVLEPMIAAEHVIQPMAFQFTAKAAAPGEQDKVHTVETEKIPIEVTTPRGKSGNIPMSTMLRHSSRRATCAARCAARWWWGAVAAMQIARGALPAWRRANAGEEAPPIGPCPTALAALRELIAEDLVAAASEKLLQRSCH